MKFYQNILIKFSTQFFKIIPFIISNILLAWMLIPEQKGEFEILITIPKLTFFIFNLGIPACNVYLIAHEKNKEKYLLGNSLLISFFLSIFFSILLYFILPYILIIFKKDINLELARIILISIFFIFTFRVLNRIFEGKKDFIYSSLYELLISFLWSVLLVILFLFHFDSSLRLIVYVWMLSLILPVFPIFIHLFIRYNIGFSKKLLIKQFLFGFKMHLSQVVLSLNYHLDLLSLGILSSLNSVGIYSIALFGSEIISRPAVYIATVLFPTVSSNTEKQNNQLTPFICRITIFITFLLGFFALLFGKLFIILFGKNYINALYPFYILVVGTIIFSATKILSTDIIGRGKPEVNFFIFLSSIIFDIILNIILIPFFHEIGAAIATSMSNFLCAVIFLLYFKFKLNFYMFDLIILKKSDIILIVTTIIKKIKKNNQSD